MSAMTPNDHAAVRRQLANIRKRIERLSGFLPPGQSARLDDLLDDVCVLDEVFKHTSD